MGCMPTLEEAQLRLEIGRIMEAICDSLSSENPVSSDTAIGQARRLPTLLAQLNEERCRAGSRQLVFEEIYERLITTNQN